MSFSRYSKSVSVISILALALISIFLTSQTSAQENSDCLLCHENPEMCADFGSLEKTKIDPVTAEIQIVSMIVDQEAFATSIHGKDDFYCIDCHGDLEESEGMHKPDLRQVDCATFCHDDPAETFRESNHVRLMKENGYTPPSCKNCHIGLAFHQSTWGKNKPMFVPHADGPAHRQLTIETCANCHKREYASYKNGFHGQVAALGVTSLDIPTCADCHGSHDILNSSNPDSQMGLQNRIEVCGKCHEGAGEKFVMHIEHPKIKELEYYKSLIATLLDIRHLPSGLMKIGKDPQTYLLITFVGYIGLLTMLFSKFGLHAVLIWMREILDERKGKDSEKHE
ncbi:MAG: hypothetical protein ACUZ8O_16525 [Candidatus Anammoxibacter sp.]